VWGTLVTGKSDVSAFLLIIATPRRESKTFSYGVILRFSFKTVKGFFSLL
jgi:hypothetical protein